MRKAISDKGSLANMRFCPLLVSIPQLLSTLAGSGIRARQSLISSGLFFAVNDLTGLGYFSAAKDLFSDIKRMTSAEEVDLLPIS